MDLNPRELAYDQRPQVHRAGQKSVANPADVVIGFQPSFTKGKT